MRSTPDPALTPLADGSLAGEGAVELALTSARLQARATPRGVDQVVVWGSGRAGAVRRNGEGVRMEVDHA